VSNTLTSVAKDNLVLEPQVLKTQRTEYGKETRKAYESGEIPGDRKAMREQVPRTDGLSNTLTTVQRDNLIAEPCGFVERAYDRFIEKKGYVPEMFNAYNRAEITESAPTLTAQCGSPTASGSILKAETDEVAKCVRVGGQGLHERHTWNVVQPANGVRIRKLTPTECLRLQGWRDSEIAKIRAAGVSNAQAYRQAGNGITTTVLMAIFGELFGVPYKSLLDNWSYA
jgi:DNA (cytosine-5)-methyltransferase 1